MSLIDKVLASLGLTRRESDGRAQYQVEKRQTRYSYNEGPMLYVGQQIVKHMEDAGWPSKIYYHYRGPALQNRLYAKGRTVKGPDVSVKRPMGRTVTNAKAFESAHNYFEAVDIVHKTLFWDAPPEYWEALQNAAKIVSEKLNVPLKLGADWGDYAHIEHKEWRKFKQVLGGTVPSPEVLAGRFEQVLPQVWRQRPHHTR